MRKSSVMVNCNFLSYSIIYSFKNVQNMAFPLKCNILTMKLSNFKIPVAYLEIQLMLYEYEMQLVWNGCFCNILYLLLFCKCISINILCSHKRQINREFQNYTFKVRVHHLLVKHGLLYTKM